jgi:transcriptional regulator with XRE-family HTH domain
MDAAQLLRRVRRRSGLSLRQLAERAGTSHSALAAYEAGRVEPSIATATRVARAAGFEVAYSLEPAVGGDDPAARGRELVEVLELAAMFPAHHTRHLDAPIFGRQ